MPSDQEHAEAARRTEAERFAATHVGRRRLRNSLSSYARWGWWLAGAVLGLCLAGSLLAWARARAFPNHEDDSNEPTYALASMTGFVPLLVLSLARSSIGARAVAREEAWLRSRPFRVVGYMEALGGPSTEGTASMTIRFASTETIKENPNAAFREPAAIRSVPPDDDTVRSAFRSVGAELVSSPNTFEKRVTYSVKFMVSVSTNAHLVGWLHRAFDVLELLHTKHPIDEVRLDGFG